MIIFLNNIFEKCPTFWKNYIRNLPSKSDIFVSYKQIHRDLKKYGATYTENLENGPMLIFDNEQNAMKFVLLWS